MFRNSRVLPSCTPQPQARQLTGTRNYRKVTIFSKYRGPRTELAVRKMPENTLGFRDGPLVWIDCEMTGLNPKADKIMEIAVRGLHSIARIGSEPIVPEPGHNYEW